MNSAKIIEVEGHSTIRSLLFLPDGTHFLSGGDDGKIRKWRITDGLQVGEPLEGEKPVRALALARNGKWIVSGEHKMAAVWERDTWKEFAQVDDLTHQVEAVDVSPCSTKFVTGAADNKVFVWDISTSCRLLGPLSHNSCPVAVKFSPDGGSIVTVSWEREIRIYNTENGQLTKTFPIKVHGMDAISWSNDSQRIFTATPANIRHIYVDTGSNISHWKIPGFTDQEDHASLAVPANGKFIVSYAGGSLSIWDPSTLAQFGPTFEHKQRLRSIAISSDNNYLVTGGEKGIIMLRNLSYIIPMPYLVRQPQNANHITHRAQTEAVENFRSLLRVLESRFDELAGIPMPQSSAPELQATLPLVPNGIYRIKSKISDLYLTRPQDSDGTVVVHKLHACNDFQEWSIGHIEDGTYRIKAKGINKLLSVGIGNELVCGSHDCTWTIEPRGNAYVIGNVANATAIHLTLRLQHVWAQLRDNSENQRWVLERVPSRYQAVVKPESEDSGSE